MGDSVGQVQSPFTLQSQVQQWPGADYWKLDLSLPSMKRDTAAAWIGFLAALRGKANVFQVGDQLGRLPRGNPQGTPVISGLHLASATSINTAGWTASATGLLKVGDYIQIGYRLHVVIGTDVNAGADGKATIEIWPSLREALADGVSIVTSNCKGLFRLADNERSWSATQAKTYGVSFKAVEAR
jgi:hypothetical protein